MRFCIAALAVTLITLPGFGAREFPLDVEVGGLIVAGGEYLGGPYQKADGVDADVAPVRTDIDLFRPASASGRISQVKLRWSGASCADTVKIKFFRRAGDTLSQTAERGPFALPAPSPCAQGWCAFLSISLPSPVEILEGDLIGVTRMGGCGSPAVHTGVPDGYVQFPDDVTGTVELAAGAHQPGGLVLGATGLATEITAGILPVAASTEGAYGSRWRTAVQMVNPHRSTKSVGRLILRRSGVRDSADDPILPYSLEPGASHFYPDLVAAFGETGVGSVDFVVVSGAFPVISARIFNDAGAAGTHATIAEVIDPAAWDLICWGGPDCPGTPVLQRGVSGFLLTPESPSRERFNIGVRALSTGATIVATLRGSDGELLHSTTRTYEPNYFEQLTAEQFLGVPIGGNQSIRLSVTHGTAIIYGVATDNITNDPSLQQVDGAVWDSRGVFTSWADRTARVLPAIERPPGASDDWTTTVQLFNPHPSEPATGHLVFHRARAADLRSDPSVPYSVAPGEVKTFGDMAAAFGEIGPGSLDVVVPIGAPVPIIVARARSEGGGNGSRGGMLQAVDPLAWAESGCYVTQKVGFRAPILDDSASGVLITPASTSESRLRIGVRTYLGGVGMTVELIDPSGDTVKTITKTYSGSEEVSIEEFLGGPIEPNHWIRIDVSGPAIVYSITIDKRTDDITVQYAWNIARHAVAVLPPP